MLIALAVTLTANAVSSCNLLGDIVKNADDIGVEAKWTEEGNKLIYEVSVNYLVVKYKQVLTFEFDGEKCIKATGEFIFDSAKLAKEFYDSLELTDEEKQTKRLDGKKIIIDQTEDYLDMTKTELKEAIESSGGWEL